MKYWDNGGNKKIIKAFKNKIISIFIAVILLSSVVMITAAIPSNAQQSVKVQAFLSVRPNVVGVGQELLINMWCTPAPGANRQYHNYELTITKPSGVKSVINNIDSYVADGTMWMPWVADEVGEWTFDFYYPGETFKAGRYYEGEFGVASGGTVYADDAIISSSQSHTVRVTVQEEMVFNFPDSPLPTDYWTRPVDEVNRNWWSILGSFPWFGYGEGEMWDMLYPNTNPHANSAYGFVPWVAGPESAHIVWKTSYQMGGLMGGDWGGGSSVSPSISGWGMKPSIVLMGRAYITVAKPGVSSPTSQNYWRCFDIRTGDIIWERPLFAGETAPTLVEYGTDAPGVVAATLAKPAMPTLLSISGGYLRRYNANTGVMSANISLGSLPFGYYYKNGYAIGVQDLGADAGAERYRLINWTTFGTGNANSRVVSNTTYARSSLISEQMSDWNSGYGASVTNLNQGGMFIGMNVSGYNLRTGETLWTVTLNEQFYSGSANVVDHGKVAIDCADGYYLAFDIRTGKEAWKTRVLDYPWDAPGWGGYGVTSAYGHLYWVAQTGIYAINWDNGEITWKYEKEAPPFETPYTGSEGQTVYPFNAAAFILDGKIYAYSSKHTPEVPFYRGQPTVCVDCFTGKEVWSIGMTGAGEFARSASQLAFGDGYMTLGERGGVMYAFGRGESETTVIASHVPLALGQKALLTGTVLDLSPAQHGAACVSHDSMAALMEQIHLQAPVGGISGDVFLEGVPVTLFVHDPNGNDYSIGTVTTDGYSGVFAFDEWTPEISGLYTITATFMGDESYGSSFAIAHLTVAEGESTSTDNTLTDNTVLYALIGIGAAIIAVVAIFGFLILRKK